MENASKALIIAGSILIAMMIIGLSILVFNKFGASAKERANMDEQEMKAFNSKITPYLGNQTGTQVNVLIQYVISNNTAVAQSGEIEKAIHITFPGGEINVNKKADGSLEVTGLDGTKRVNTNRTSSGAVQMYNVNATYDGNGLITTITIT